MEQRLIEPAAPAQAAALFDGWQETLIWSALEGCMGRIWVVSQKPRAALCETGDFLFLSGAAQDPESRVLLEAWKRGNTGFKILVPRDQACGALIEELFGRDVVAGTRYAFEKGGEHFDAAKLLRLKAGAPEGVDIVPVDGALYHQAAQNEWSRDFVSQFHNAQDYLRRGIGFAALHEGRLVGGASSYTCYSKGIEIEVQTLDGWRRRGIASACCAALILECLKRGLYPSWDASNPVSVALAQKLGYRLAGPYPVWIRGIHK